MANDLKNIRVLKDRSEIDRDNYNYQTYIEILKATGYRRSDVADANKLIKVFNDTRKLSNTKFKRETEELINNAKVYSNILLINKNDKCSDAIFIFDGTLEVSNYLSRYYKVAALNFADGIKPGGLPEYGCLTQEENICRCSNMYEALISDKCDRGYYQVNKDNYNDGLCTDTVIYLPNVTIFKDDRDYKPINLK